MKRRKIAIVALAILVTGFSPLVKPFPGILFAEEIVVSGNGAESSNTVASTTQAETTVQQTNQSQTTNDVSVNADTGNNEASKNNGDTAIKTGDVDASTEIANQGNVSVVDASNCCPTGEKSITVAGNGTGSSNSVDATNTTTVTTTTNQTATITNNISGIAITGGNRANDNLGNVTIITGNILHRESIINDPINISSITVGLPSTGYTVKVNGNGAYTNNDVNLRDTVSHISFITNTADIFNNSFWNLITGNNYASRNNGDVFIKTGDIESKVTITNKANISVVKEDCCKLKPSEVPTPTPPSPTPPGGKPGDGNGGGGNGGGGGGNGGGNGSSTPASGSVLPVTGGGSWAVLLLIGNIIMLFFGVLLRLRSGRSPGSRFNFGI